MKNCLFLVIFCIVMIFIPSCSNLTEPSEITIGVINLKEIEISKTYKALQNQIEQLKNDMEKKLEEFEKEEIKNLPNLQYFLKTNFDEKKEKLYNEFEGKLIKAIYYTANQKKIGLVVSYNVLPYGGIDITKEVIQNLDNNNFQSTPMFNNVQIISYIDDPNIKNLQLILHALKELYKERKIYVVVNKKEIFLGGFDLNEKLRELQKQVPQISKDNPK